MYLFWRLTWQFSSVFRIYGKYNHAIPIIGSPAVVPNVTSLTKHGWKIYHEDPDARNLSELWWSQMSSRVVRMLAYVVL